MSIFYRCMFGSGRGPEIQCPNPANRISTLHGKRCIGDRGGLVWCPEHHTGPEVTEGHDVELLNLPDLALSVRQPWAWLIQAGYKPFENREWSRKNPGRKFTGTAFLHAASSMTQSEYDEAAHWAMSINQIRLPSRKELRFGGIIGTVDFVKWHDVKPNLPYAFGSGFEIANPKPLPFLPCIGRLGFFRPEMPDAEPVKQFTTGEFSLQ